MYLICCYASTSSCSTIVLEVLNAAQYSRQANMLCVYKQSLSAYILVGLIVNHVVAEQTLVVSWLAAAVVSWPLMLIRFSHEGPGGHD